MTVVTGSTQKETASEYIAVRIGSYDRQYPKYSLNVC